MRKRWVVFLLAVVSVFSLSACGASEEDEAAMSAMSEKLETSVSFEKRSGSGFLAETELYDTPVYLEQQDDGSYRDNLIAVQYEDETVVFLEDCARTYFETANVYYTVSNAVVSDMLSEDASFEAFLADSGLQLQAMIEIRESEFTSQELVVQMAGSLAMYGTQMDLAVVIVPDDVFGQQSQSDLEKLVRNDEFAAYAHVVCAGGAVDIQWAE